jgi:hypothetical protein
MKSANSRARSPFTNPWAKLPLTPQPVDQVAHPRVRSASESVQNVRHGGLELFRNLSSASGKDSRPVVTLATRAGNVVGNRFQRTGRGNPDESISEGLQ